MLAGMIGAGVMVAVIVFFSYYKVDTVEVRGTSHYTDEEVKNMVLRGPMASNSVLAPLLYSTTNTEDIAYVDAFKVTQLNRNTICISVKEKKTVGCIRYLDSYIYFDRNGIFVEGSQNRDETVPYFDGIQVNSIVMDEKLDIKGDTVLNTAVALSTIFQKNDMIPDHIQFDSSYSISLIYGDITVQLGKDADLEEKMNKAAEELEFEEAARYRDLLSSVRQVSQKQKITEGVGEDKDILALYQDETEAVVQVFFVRDGKLIGREHYYMTHVPENNKPAILQDFVKQFYAGTPFIPRELMLQYEIEDAELIEKWLSERKGSRVYLKVPKIGSKEKLVELAAQNAKLVLSQDREKLKREEGRTIGAVKEISDLLQLPLTGTARMEAYDISNINGFENVGSMVVYEKGKPKRSDYRKFKIKSVSGPDDYACMREVLMRRFRHGMEESKELEEQEMDQEYGSFTKFPDLILMDGGRGQVNIALSVLEELGIDIPVCGMVKDDNHRTRGLYYHNIELPIDTHSEGFKLITRIQDEAHRFAIEYHRSLRSKTQVRSVLDDIPGVGPARRKALMRHFKSLEEIRQATVEELMEIPKMNERTAEEIVTFFASQTGQPVVH